MKYRVPKTRATMARETAVAYGEPAAPAPGPTRQIQAGDFKARCLSLMDEVSRTGGEYVITKRGVPVARLVPVRMKRRRLLGSMKGTVTTLGDIVSPLEETWNALEGWDDDERS